MLSYKAGLCDLFRVGVLSSQRPGLLKGMSPFQGRTLSWASMFYDKELEIGEVNEDGEAGCESPLGTSPPSLSAANGN